MKYINELFLSLLAFFSPIVYATDTYNHVNNQLTIPAVVVGEIIYRDVVITVGPILTVGGSSLDSKYPAKPSTSYDSYDPYKNQLTIPSVSAYGFVYYDVVINVGTVLSVGASSPVSTITLYKTSYENAKLQNIPRLNIVNPNNYTSAWAVGNFFGDNKMAVMIAKSNSLQCYKPNGIDPNCIGTAPMYIKDEHRAEFQFFKLSANGNLESTTTKIAGCLTPRKAVVADFNNDGHPDIFVVCHGWDMQVNGKWPGEINKLLLNDSKGQGKFAVSDVGTTSTSYYHGAAAADVNGDGWIDIVITDSFRSPGANITALINQKNGTFVFDNNRIFGQGNTAGYYSVELVDVDKDGIIDIIAGGHESPIGSAETVVLYGNSNNTFGTRKTVIPGIAEAPSALDFTVAQNASNQPVIYIGRTTYSNNVLQAYNVSTKISSLLFNQTGTWIEWWTIQTKNNVLGIAPYASKNPDLFFTIQ
jgi:hypothetical protein